MRKLIRSVLQKWGYDIIKYKQPYKRGRLIDADLQEEFKWLKSIDFGAIVDIGANEGQFADRMRCLFPEARIFAFEPIPLVFEKLQENFQGDENFRAYNLGLGSEIGSMEIQVNEYSPSSSFLSLNSTHIQHFEEAVKTSPTLVQIDTLDSVMAHVDLSGRVLIKLDVQGFEDKVIAGGKDTISKAHMIICELSFVELYKNQPLFEDIYESLRKLGFKYAGSIEQLRSPETNRILQADGVFIRN